MYKLLLGRKEGKEKGFIILSVNRFISECHELMVYGFAQRLFTNDFFRSLNPLSLVTVTLTHPTITLVSLQCGCFMWMFPYSKWLHAYLRNSYSSVSFPIKGLHSSKYKFFRRGRSPSCLLVFKFLGCFKLYKLSTSYQRWRKVSFNLIFQTLRFLIQIGNSSKPRPRGMLSQALPFIPDGMKFTLIFLVLHLIFLREAIEGS